MSKTTECQLDIFYELSAALVDFETIDLIGTGVAQEYFDELVRGAGQEHVDALLEAAEEAGRSKAKLREIFEDVRFGPLAKNVMLMWLLGSWYPLSKDWHEEFRPDAERVSQHVVSARAYQEALWPLIVGAHQRGTKPPGFGSWGEEAVLGGHDAGWVKEQRAGSK